MKLSFTNVFSEKKQKDFVYVYTQNDGGPISVYTLTYLTYHQRSMVMNSFKCIIAAKIELQYGLDHISTQHVLFGHFWSL